MKHIILTILCAVCAFTAHGQSIEQLKVQYDAASTPGAKWAVVQNWSTIQAEAARAEKAQLQAVNAALIAKLQAAGTNHAALLAVRAEVIAPEVAERRAKLAAELAAKQAELDAIK